MTGWDPLADWWVEEVGGDPAYRRDVDPILQALTADAAGVFLDLGCGTGRHLGTVATGIGVESSPTLARIASEHGVVVIGDAGSLPFAGASVAGAYAVLVVEHMDRIEPLFSEAARVVEPGGDLVVVMNHPVYTAPGSGPFIDDDGEPLWRWGAYFEHGWTDEPAGPGVVRFHHHPLGELLGGAAAVGWVLQQVIEAPSGAHDDPLLAAQRSIPRLLGLRWRLSASQ